MPTQFIIPNLQEQLTQNQVRKKQSALEWEKCFSRYLNDKSYNNII